MENLLVLQLANLFTWTDRNVLLGRIDDQHDVIGLRASS
jgi:hypothetical protein